MMGLYCFLLISMTWAFQPIPHRPSAFTVSPSRLAYATACDYDTPTSVRHPPTAAPSPPVYDHIFEAPSLYAIRVLLKHSRQQNALAVVRYHAPYCRACLKVAPLMDRLGRRNTDLNFIHVNVSNQNPDKSQILETLRVPSIPWGQIWHPQAGLVEELSVNPKHFPDFVRILKSYQDNVCPLPEEVYQECGVYAAPYRRNGPATGEERRH